MRYQGQNYEQEVPFPSGELDDDALRDAYESYGRLYEEFYGYRLDGIPIELVRLAVIATGETPFLPPSARRGRPGARPGDERRVLPRRRNRRTRGSCAGRRSRRETELAGPAIVEFMDSTVVVPPGWALETREDGILEVTR